MVISMYLENNHTFIIYLKGYIVRFGTSNYILRVGPSTLKEAKAFCDAEKMILYKPKNREALHRLIFSKVSKYGATTFWTQAQYLYANDFSNLQKSKMTWM